VLGFVFRVLEMSGGNSVGVYVSNLVPSTAEHKVPQAFHFNKLFMLLCMHFARH
jgi:hypothetical protein